MSVERVVKAGSGWVMLVVVLAMYLVVVAGFVVAVIALAGGSGAVGGTLMVAASLLLTLAIVMSVGFFSLQPNEARVLVLFGEYRGTVRESGFYWANPFYSNAAAGTAARPAAEAEGKQKQRTSIARFKVSLRARTLVGEKLKVNDRRGNPVEIAAVVVWRVADTAQAVFDVEDFPTYVATQTETALRHVATAYDYDQGVDEGVPEVTLRGNPDEVSTALREDLARRLAVAGVVVDDARLTHLAYAPEIAQAMLRRQQAEAVIAARRKIVNGAVGMVDMALRELSEQQVVELDGERRAAMVSNLMVVLCGESDVTPVLNAGSGRG